MTQKEKLCREKWKGDRRGKRREEEERERGGEGMRRRGEEEERKRPETEKTTQQVCKHAGARRKMDFHRPSPAHYMHHRHSHQVSG